jgi:cobalt/nickel transport system permease protein
MKIDTLAYTNRLNRLPPEHKLGFALVLLLISYLAPIAVQMLIFLWVSVWIVIYAKIPAAVYFKLLGITIGFWVMSIPALILNGVGIENLAQVRADSWGGWRWGDFYLYISHQGVTQATTLGIRSIAASACIYLILLTVPFSALLDILRRIGCPTLMVELLFLMYRFIFVLLATAQEIWIAQQSRGGYRTRQVWLKSISLLIGQLLRRTLANYQQVSLSLAARGFNGELQVWHSRPYIASKRYIWEAAIGCVILVFLAGLIHVVGIRAN